MGVLAWIVAPWLRDQLGGDDPFAEALLICITAGLVWQFVLVLIMLRRELGALEWSRVREALWLVPPKDPKSGQPVENGARNVWVTETALSTALNVAYFAESVSMWAIVMGFALVLTGIGFLVLTLSLFRNPRHAAALRTQPGAMPAAG